MSNGKIAIGIWAVAHAEKTVGLQGGLTGMLQEIADECQGNCLLLSMWETAVSHKNNRKRPYTILSSGQIKELIQPER